jgi:hypothetical protein
MNAGSPGLRQWYRARRIDRAIGIGDALLLREHYRRAPRDMVSARRVAGIHLA